MGSPAVDVRERPILFSGEMVRALLDGRKTQTRRVVTNKTALEWLRPGVFSPSYVADPDNHLSPFGYAGDVLWVRESHAVLDMRPDIVLHDQPWPPSAGTCWPASVTYRADEATLFWDDLPAEVWRESFDNDHRTWRPSIHMPRWARRLTLELTDVRVERVQEISEADCDAEGMGGAFPHMPECPHSPVTDSPRECDCHAFTLPEIFAARWDRLNGKRGYGWDANPWVWALTFGVRSQTPETTP